MNVENEKVENPVNEPRVKTYSMFWDVLLPAIRLQQEARIQNGGKRPTGMELMGWLKDAAENMSSVLGIECQPSDEHRLSDCQECQTIRIDQMTEMIKNPTTVMISPWTLRIVIGDSDGKRYAIRSTEISFKWEKFVAAIESYGKLINEVK